MEQKKCLKIKLTKIGPFDNWDSSVVSIGHSPIKIGIFAKNGTGKSTIAKQIQSSYDKNTFDSKKLIKKGHSQGDFILEIKNNNDTLEKNKLKVINFSSKESYIKKEGNYIYYVFNREYTKKNITKFDDTIKGFIIGEKKKNETKFEDAIKKLKKENSVIWGEINDDIENIKEELKGLGVRPNTKEFSLLSFDNFKNGFDLEKNQLKSFDNSKDDYLKFREIDDSVLETEIFNINEHFINFSNFKFKTENLLNENIDISTTPKELKSKIESKKDFISKGIELSETNGFEECPFCESEISSKKSPLRDYISYLENQESILKSNIKIALKDISEISDKINAFRNELLEKSNKLNYSTENFPQFKKALKCPEIKVSDHIDFFKKILETKLNDVIYTPSKKELTEIDKREKSIDEELNKLYKYRTSLNSEISRFDKIRTNYKKEITKLRKELILSKLNKIEKESNIKLGTYKENENQIIDLQTKLDSVKDRIDKEKIVIETFSKLLKVVFHDKFYFDKDKSILKSSDNFDIDDASSFLSEGELRIISFLHYLSSVHTFVKHKNDYKNLFLIIDDPVASVDFHYSYSICTIINNLKSHLKSNSNLNFIVFTHNLEFMELLSSNGIIKDRFEMTSKKFLKLKKTFIPYLDHLRDIITVSKNSEEASHTTANSLRYIIEYISKFESPGSKLEDLIDKNEQLNKCAFLKTFIHNESHGTFKKTESVSKEFVSDGCKSLVKFIQSKYPKQLESIKN